MKVKFWGTRGSMPTALNYKDIQRKLDYYRINNLPVDAQNVPFWVNSTYGTGTSCVQMLTESSTQFLCDAGSGIREFAVNWVHNKPLVRDFHIFVSHLHWDHIQGFPFFFPIYSKKNMITIHGCHDGIEEALHTQMSAPFFPVDLKDLAPNIEFIKHEPNKSFQIEDCVITPYLQNHPGDSYGYRFQDANSGKVAVYSTDSEHKMEYMDDPNYHFLDFIKEADLLIFDAMYSMVDAVHEKENWGHSSNMMGVNLATRAHVKHLCLFHMEPTLSDQELDRFLNDTIKYNKIHNIESNNMEISIAYDGLELTL